MFIDLFQWSVLAKIFFNTVLISIPEELYWVLFIYIMMGELDYWEDEKKLIYSWDYPRVLIPVLFTAIISNICRYTGINSDLVSVVTILSVFIIIVAMGDIFNNAAAPKWVGKAFIFMLLGLLTIFVCEFSYTPFVLYATGKSVIDINNDIVLNFCISLPSRLMEYGLLAYLIAKKKTLLRANIIKMIFESKLLMSFTLITLSADAIYIIFMVKVVGYEKVLINLPSDIRLALILSICIFPLLNLSALIWCTYFVKNRETEKQKEASDTIRKFVEEIKTYTNNENSDNIIWKINGLANNLEEVADNLYLDSKNK